MGGVQIVEPQAVFPAQSEVHWYAIQTRPRHEKKVCAEVQEKRIESYLPLLTQVHRWSDRNKLVQVPLFPGYVFIHAHLDAWVRLSILRVWGALNFVGAQCEPVAIPDSEIEAVQTLLRTQISLTPFPFLRVGQRVRVRGGVLDGMEGILVTNDKRHLVVSVEGIQRSLSISIEGYDVEPA